MTTEEHKDRLNIAQLQAHYWRTQLERHDDELSRKLVRVFEPLLLGLGTLLAKSMEEDKKRQESQQQAKLAAANAT